MRIPAPVALAVALAAALAQPAASLQIDNFEEGTINCVDPISGVTGTGATLCENAGLSTANVVGGVRLVSVTAASDGTLTGVATATAALVPTPVDDGVALTVVGVPEGHATYEFIYDGIANGTADGRFGSLNLDLTPYSDIEISMTAVNVTATLQLAMSSSTFTQFSSVIPLANGSNIFALSGFNLLNLSDIQQVRLFIQGIDVGEAPIMNYIQTVPEPATGVLAAFGLVGLAIRRRIAR
jgi:hypothetical protein